MFSFKGKEYEYLVWDWRSTLWDPFTKELYPWVKEFFENTKGVTHILVCFTIDTEKRLKIIEDAKMTKYFKYISATGEMKREVFEEVFDKGIAQPDKSLVIGDNMNDEIKAAKDLAIDCVHIREFVREISFAKKQ